MIKPVKRIILSFAAVLMATQLFAFKADEPVSGPAKTATAAALKTVPQKMPTDGQKDAAEALDGAKVEWDAKTGAPASIRGKDLSAKNLGGKGLSLSPKNDFAVDALAVMDRLTKAYRLRDASAEFKSLKPEADELGFHHVRMDQMYQGLRVIGGQMIVHFNKSGQAYQVNGRYITDINLETKPAIDANSAVASAQTDLAKNGKPAGTLKGAVELVVYAQDVDPVLAYELTLVYNDKEAGPGNWRYWVNANDGTIINCYNDIRKAEAPAKSNATISGSLNSGEGGSSVSVTGDYSSSYYYLRYTGNHWEIYDYYNDRTCRSLASTWGTAAWFRSEMSAACNFNLIQTYYLNIHSRNSYDNAGAKATANVHVTGGSDNAFWYSATQQFYFYPGSELAELTVLDVCGHEFTHAVTEKTSDLVYQYEPGALNESFSDIFGAVIEFANQPDGRGSYPSRTAGYADWLLAEDCSYTTSDVAMRDMRNPRRYGQPSKYHGTGWYYGSSDNGGVHYNSGVQNHFFYLLCEGGSGSNDGISYNITSIGLENARLIAYRALTRYCTRNTDHAAARTAWISAATDLNSAWVSAVQQAWAAVGVDSSTPTHASNLRIQGLNNDFDNDDIGDFALYNYPYGNWYIWSSLYATWFAYNINFGSSGYLPVPGDYNGDGYADVALYSRSTAWWMIFYTGVGAVSSFQCGSYYCIPAPGDYDGDGKTDFALYDFTTGAWYIFSSLTQSWLTYGTVFGSYGYIPVPGDYNGGGKSDLVVYSEELGLWLLFYPETGQSEYLQDFGGFGFIPAPGDYDNDGVTDFGLYDYWYGYWYIWSPVNGWITDANGFKWANYNGYYYTPVAGDYDGDGISDLAVYSRYYGDWYIYYIGTGSSTHLTGFGGTYYVPVTYWALYWYM